MCSVEFRDNMFRISKIGEDDRHEDANYVFTEDIGILVVWDEIDNSQFHQFDGVKINTLYSPDVNFVCNFISAHGQNIHFVYVSNSELTLEDFINTNQLICSKISLYIPCDIPGLMPEHFVNKKINYVLTANLPIVQENARVLTCLRSIKWDGVNLDVCEYDKIIFTCNTLTKNATDILYKLKIDKFEACDLDDDMIPILGQLNIRSIILKRKYSELESKMSALNIDPLLDNPAIEYIKVKGRDSVYTKLADNLTIKKLNIKGKNCDQKLISEVCCANVNRGNRYKNTKSAKKIV